MVSSLTPAGRSRHARHPARRARQRLALRARLLGLPRHACLCHVPALLVQRLGRLPPGNAAHGPAARGHPQGTRHNGSLLGLRGAGLCRARGLCHALHRTTALAGVRDVCAPRDARPGARDDPCLGGRARGGSGACGGTCARRGGFAGLRSGGGVRLCRAVAARLVLLSRGGARRVRVVCRDRGAGDRALRGGRAAPSARGAPRA